MTTCAEAIALDRLLDYWFGELIADEAERLEDHQWSCDACTRRLGWIAGLGPAVDAVLRRRGGLRIVLTTALVEQLARDGVQMRHYRTAGNHDLACSVSRDDDLVVSWFEVEANDDERVTIEAYAHGGPLLVRTEDLPIERLPDGRGQLVIADPGDFIRTLPTMVLQFRLIGVDPAGAERDLGAYIFRHTAISG